MGILIQIRGENIFKFIKTYKDKIFGIYVLRFLAEKHLFPFFGSTEYDSS